MFIPKWILAINIIALIPSAIIGVYYIIHDVHWVWHWLFGG